MDVLALEQELEQITARRRTLDAEQRRLSKRWVEIREALQSTYFERYRERTGSSLQMGSKLLSTIEFYQFNLSANRRRAWQPGTLLEVREIDPDDNEFTIGEVGTGWMRGRVPASYVEQMRAAYLAQEAGDGTA